MLSLVHTLMRVREAWQLDADPPTTYRMDEARLLCFIRETSQGALGVEVNLSGDTVGALAPWGYRWGAVEGS